MKLFFYKFSNIFIYFYSVTHFFDQKKPTVAAGNEVVFGSTEYYAKCAVGGAISCGLTHTLIVPLDLVKSGFNIINL